MTKQVAYKAWFPYTRPDRLRHLSRLTICSEENRSYRPHRLKSFGTIRRVLGR